jgi:hypothetical protein
MTTTAYAFATATVVTTVDGVRVNLTAGEAWHADDPVVRARPDLFSDVPPRLHTLSGGVKTASRNTEVEQATAGPGERRSTRAPARRKATDK